MNNLLQELRARTSDLHRQLDEQAQAKDPTTDLDAYVEYLKQFHQGLAGSWPMLDWKSLEARELPDLAMRKERYLSLGKDLESLGFPTAPLEDRREADPATTAGCLYVLEGSIHGGRMLLSRLEKNGVGLPPGCTRFMTGFGSENSGMWSHFTGWLDSLETSPESIDRAREGAALAFSHFIRSFTP